MIKIKKLWHSNDASWFTEEEFEVSRLSEDQVLVKSIYSLISLGTEGMLIRDPLSDMTSEKMAVPYMEGKLGNRFTYGYSLVGEVIKGPQNWLNKFVHVLHPHQNYGVVKKDDLYLIPDGISLQKATLASNMETAINAFWDSKIKDNNKVLILGLGIIGILTASVLRYLSKCGIEVLDINPEKNKTAEEMGFVISDQFRDQYDIIFHCSGNSSGLQKSLELCKREGKILEMSWYGSKPISVSLGNDFHFKRLKIISSQVSSIPKHMSSKWNFRKRKDFVFKLLGHLQLDWVVNDIVEYDNTPEIYKQLRNGNLNSSGIMIKY